MSKNIKVNIDTNRIKKKYEKQFAIGRMRMKSEIAKDSGPYLPFREGTLEKSVNESIARDDNFLIWDIIYARFLYFGKVMVGATSKRAYAKKYEMKVVTDKDLEFFIGRRPKAGPFWFEEAKKINIDKWITNFKKFGGN